MTRARLRQLDLADDPPPRDDPDLASAERKVRAALASQWLGRGGTLDIVASERPPWTW